MGGVDNSYTKRSVLILFYNFTHVCSQKVQAEGLLGKRYIPCNYLCRLGNVARDRFLAILSNFHISDNSTAVSFRQPGHDPLQKLRPYIHHLLVIMRNSFYPFENLTIDEGTCAFRGRLRFRIYNKNKPGKYGIKLYVVCNSATGYILKFEVYTGKMDNNSVIDLYQRLLFYYLGKSHKVLWTDFTLPLPFLTFCGKTKPRPLELVCGIAENYQKQ